MNKQNISLSQPAEPVKVPSDEELLKWAGEEQFFLFCDEDEFLQIAREVLSHYGGRQSAASTEPRPDEYDYFVNWYDKEAPDESEVSNFDMARQAWLAGIRFAGVMKVTPVAQDKQDL